MLEFGKGDNLQAYCIVLLCSILRYAKLYLGSSLFWINCIYNQAECPVLSVSD